MNDAGTDTAIHGFCAPAFVRVREAFARNFALRNEVGAAVAAWVDGDLVVNLWGGSADAAGTRPWRQDTLTTVLSGTKGLSATCIHQLADRGELDLQAPVARYWPEFGQAGKQDITLAMVMCHRSGVIGPRTRMRWEDVADWDHVCEQLAAAAIAQQRAEAEVTGAPLPAAPAPVVVEPEGIIIAAVETEAPAEKPKRTRK